MGAGGVGGAVGALEGADEAAGGGEVVGERA